MLALGLSQPSTPMQDNTSSIQEAAMEGLHSISHLISHLSSSPPSPSDCTQLTNSTVSKFKHLISVLKRTGHARFRRGPVVQTEQNLTRPKSQNETLSLDFSLSNNSGTNNNNSSSFDLSSVTGDGSVSNGKKGVIGTRLVPIGRPPVPVSLSPPVPVTGVKRKNWCQEHAHSENVLNGKFGTNGSHCHCTKKRKTKVKKTIRVPAVSSKNADIPPDEFSWRKYGQKPIKGSPYPRGYYKCSTRRGCPARKHVERDPQDPTMLIVTYEGDHYHNTGPEPLASLPPPVTIRSESMI